MLRIRRWVPSCACAGRWRRGELQYVERLNDQVFLGQPCTYGDDRHLTNLALVVVGVVLAPEADSTLVPGGRVVCS